GLSVLEYFISTHGARKGLADTGGVGGILQQVSSIGERFGRGHTAHVRGDGRAERRLFHAFFPYRLPDVRGCHEWYMPFDARFLLLYADALCLYACGDGM